MAGPRPTLIHFTLIFCVLLTLGLGAATWTLAKERKAKEALLTRLNDDNATADRALTQAQEENGQITQRLGYNHPEVGIPVDGEYPENSILNEFYDDLRASEGTMGVNISDDPNQPAIDGTVVGQNATDALIALREEITRLEQTLATFEAETDQLNTRTVSVQTGIGTRTAQIQTSQEDSAARLQQLIAQHDNLVQAKQDMINQLSSETRREQTEKEELRDEFNRVQMTFDTEEAERNQRLEALNLQLENVRQISFERADGMIVDVDNARQEVYINLGSADMLIEQVTFSVYVQNHNGIGRGVQDVKGAIEVTRILGPHQALARITYDDITRPIAPGDPIFSPIWHSGLSEQFAFVGILDVDGDEAGDWELLHDIIQHAGSNIQLYVDDMGNTHPPAAPLSVQTKYLVVGTILDQTDYPGIDEMQEIAAKMQREHLRLTSETLKYGIRIVTAEEFLTYIGYMPQEYHWVPGQQRDFNFQGGTPPPTARDLFGQDATRNEFEGLTDDGGFYDNSP